MIFSIAIEAKDESTVIAKQAMKLEHQIKEEQWNNQHSSQYFQCHPNNYLPTPSKKFILGMEIARNRLSHESNFLKTCCSK